MAVAINNSTYALQWFHKKYPNLRLVIETNPIGLDGMVVRVFSHEREIVAKLQTKDLEIIKEHIETMADKLEVKNDHQKGLRDGRKEA